ncbi:similar to Saccharomyces cerevisiae YMR028W TAP42 Essential protein involved in the TOR signaling pathway [Maudiozyma saulgeensis]|uniref:Similar to Saccharomyces cerevisiae YMR028W TAP42 Essential protein involved in the TOR signaling pathway n=1 Tax=Maudiozyma saulgeensis TaxID=1789683 RepID=A0A1X7R831_9SACH|nr:similar to Saccharomyces cerevisiae YMR028W TAP42 Essential protein involved in the TOR signaling pathway [Kazachstania saulgeensis]
MSSPVEEYSQIVNIYTKEIEHPTSRQDSEQFQKLLSANIENLLELKSTITNKLALFSSNETLDDLTTSSIKFLSMDYYLALMCCRRQSYAKDMDGISKNRIRLMFLEKSIQLFVQFLISLEDYEILDKSLGGKIDSFKVAYRPTMDELYEVNVENSSGNEELTMAYKKRQQKIEFFQRSKQLTANIQTLESKVNSIEIDNENDKEELLRDLYIQNLKQLSYSAFNEIEQIMYETELLKNFIKNPPPKEDHPSVNEEDQRKAIDETGYTDRLETLNKPLLSKNGKILRNFTLIDKKTELKSKVRGYGQYGPTMSVEEFLQKEWEDGRVLQGGPESANPQEDLDEDNEEYNDRETYKAREFDDFKDNHAKGSGNTMNMG